MRVEGLGFRVQGLGFRVGLVLLLIKGDSAQLLEGVIMHEKVCLYSR